MIDYAVCILDENSKRQLEYSTRNMPSGYIKLVKEAIKIQPPKKHIDSCVIFFLDMGDFNISVATCRELYFVTVIESKHIQEIKNHSAFFAFFIGQAVANVDEEYFNPIFTISLLKFDEQTFTNFMNLTTTLFNPDEMKYIEVFLPFNASIRYGDTGLVGDDYSNYTMTVEDLFEAAQELPNVNTIISSNPNVLLLKFAKYVQIIVYLRDELVGNNEEIKRLTTRLITIQFIVFSTLIPEIEEEEEDNGESPADEPLKEIELL